MNKQQSTVKPSVEPMTEVKRVPYRINQQDEGDMFDVFSYSSDFKQMNAQAAAKSSVPQQQEKETVGTGLMMVT